ncbi:2-dehydropantoate 2-reductase [Pseudokineococcus sp. 5B2Z-1]|uniref:2-dehydropantoate 2-reductase n=1 Tax=Pseudokineococcus sp. 5B2Z-1 TaxID=3132744 RepID=UPI00309B589F
MRGRATGEDDRAGGGEGYTVVGAGAIGGTLAWHLARAGHRVLLVDADADHVAAVARDGLVLEREGRREAVRVPVTTPDGVPEGAGLGAVLLAVKAQATDGAARWLAPRLADDGFVVSLQNGLNEEVIAARVGVERTVGAFVDLFADVVEPGVVRDGGVGALVVGEVDGSRSARVHRVVEDLRAWGDARETEDVSGFLWAKLAFGAVLTATALADAPMAGLVDRHRPTAHGLVREVLAVARAVGVAPAPFDAFDPAAYEDGDEDAADAATDALVAWLATQSKDRSGIWRDIAVRRRPSEVTTHYPPVLAAARAHHLPVPLLEALLAQLAEVEVDPTTMAEVRLERLDAAAAETSTGETAVPDGTGAQLRAWLEEHLEEALEDLRAYVEVETPSRDRVALDAGLELVERWLDQRLGPPPAPARRVDGGEHGEVVVRDIAGSGDGPPVVLLAHYDTVWPKGTIAGMPFSVHDGVVRGPGVFDMKSGLVQLVWAVLALRHLGLPHPRLRLLLNGDEEVGSPASRPVIEEEARSAREVLVLEASAGGALKTARKGVGLFEVHLTGIEGHAGLDPTAGASAISALARVITQVDAVTDLDAGTSLNVGVVAGGTGSNVTAGRAWGRLDVRVTGADEQERVERALEALDPGDPRVSLEVRGGWNRPVMERTPGGAALFERARGLAARELGLDLRETSVGGASDGNFASAAGAVVLDGLGAVGDGAHARHEHATTDGLVERTALLALLLASGAETA